MAEATTDKVRENYYRRKAKRLGLWLQKSRAKQWYFDNQCGYMISDPFVNVVIWGEKWDLDLDDVAQILDDHEKKLIAD